MGGQGNESHDSSSLTPTGFSGIDIPPPAYSLAHRIPLPSIPGDAFP